MTNQKVLESWAEQKHFSKYAENLFHIANTLYYKQTDNPIGHILATEEGEKVLFLNENHYAYTEAATVAFCGTKFSFFSGKMVFAVPFAEKYRGHFKRFRLYEVLDLIEGSLVEREIVRVFNLAYPDRKKEGTEKASISFWSEDLLETVRLNLHTALWRYFDFSTIDWPEKEQNRIGFLRGNGVVLYIGYDKDRKFKLTAEAENTTGQIWISRNWPRVLNEIKKIYDL
jgi:hypothetical protein